MHRQLVTALARALAGLLVASGVFAALLLREAPAFVRGGAEVHDAGQQQLTLAEVAALPGSAWQQVDTRQLSWLSAARREVWLRLPLAAEAGGYPNGTRLVAEIASPYLRELDFYVVKSGQLQSFAAFGSDRPTLDRASLYPALHLTAEPQAQLLVHATSELVLPLPLKVYTEATYEQEASARTRLLWTWAGIYFGMMLFTLVVAVALRERAYLYYCGFQASLLVTGILLIGAQRLAGLDLNMGLCLRLVAAVILGDLLLFAAFLRAFAHTKQNNAQADRWFLPFNLWTLALAPAVAFAPLAVAMAAVTATAAVGLLTITLLSALRGRRLSGMMLVFGLAGMGGGALLQLCVVLGLVPMPVQGDLACALAMLWQAFWFSIAIGLRLSTLETDRRQLIATIKGAAPVSELNQMLGDKFNKSHGLSEMNMTIMFIDIVGFSQLSEILGSERIFQHLARLMREMTAIIEECQGTVDRSLGDGILCFFGYDSGGLNFQHHAQHAFKAAVKIQQAIVAQFAKERPASDYVLPVRIGIHVADVLIGDLGGKRRVDFTVIGSGVNFASRLETACSPFKIMISDEGYRHLARSTRAEPGFSKIFVAVKHQDLLVGAYEYNPFVTKAPHLGRVERLHLDQLQLMPRDSRYTLKADQQLHLHSGQRRFQVLDFSNHGFRVVSDTYMGRKVTMLVEVVCELPAMEAALKRTLLTSFYVEVRWSRRIAGGYEHGLKIFGLNTEQRLELFTHLDLLLRHGAGEVRQSHSA